MAISFAAFLRKLLLFGGAYLAVDALYHLTNLRLVDAVAAQTWPRASLLYARILDLFYGSFALLAALLCFELRRDLRKYKKPIRITAVWAFIHGLLLLHLAAATDFPGEFEGIRSLYAWTLFYNHLLLLEGAVLILYTISVCLWTRHELG